MNNKVLNLLMFVAGAAVGSTATWLLLKKRYASIADQEISEVREYYRAKYESTPVEETPDEKPAIDAEKEEVREYNTLVKETGYNSNSYIERKIEDPIKNDDVHVIPPDDYGEFEDYETESLTYYADKVLAYTNGKAIEDIEELVGSDSLNCFGEYEDDSVFVRNDRLKTDYEILLDTRTYAEAASINHPLADD